MKKIFSISIAFILFFISLLLIASLGSDLVFASKLWEIFKIRSGNLFENADFKNGLNGWSYDKNVSIIETNKDNYICIENNGSKRVRIWQDLNVFRDRSYILSFRLDSPSEGFSLLCENLSSKDKTQLECHEKKYYSILICPENDGVERILFNTYKRGKYYISDITLFEYNSTKFLILKVIAYLIIFVLLILIFRINFLFVILILILLILPMLKISNKTKSNVENRNLSKFKNLLFFDKKHKKKKVNTNFGNDFNLWLNDHFFLREFLIKKANYGKMIFNNCFENDYILTGKDNFHFMRSDISTILKSKNISELEYNKTLNSLKRFRDFCSTNNIELYIIVAPFGAEIYKEKLPGINLDNFAGCYSNTINRLKTDLNIDIVYAFDCLMDAKKEGFVYYKNDHHWTQLGGYKGYRLIMDEIVKNHINLIPTTEDKYDITYKKARLSGSYFDRMNLDSRYYKKAFSRESYPLFVYHNKDSINGSLKISSSGSVVSNKFGYDRKVFMFGDSFIMSYYPFFAYTFKFLQGRYKANQIYMPLFEKHILNYMPDIVIMNIYAPNCQLIKNWYLK